MLMEAASPRLWAIDPGLVWAIAMVVGIAVAMQAARRHALNIRTMYWAALWSLLGAFLGGHALYVAASGTGQQMIDYVRFWTGAASSLGAFAGGALFCAAYFRVRREPGLRYFDAATPAVALAYALARIGCFINGDDFGSVTDVAWAVRFPPGTAAHATHVARGWIAGGAAASLPLHPVQLYSALAALAIGAGLATWRPRLAGARVAALALTYGTTRFLLEFFRGDVEPVFASLTLAQCLSVAMVMCGTGVWLHAHRSARSGSVPVLAAAGIH